MRTLFKAMITDKEINELAKEIHQINLDNGFGVNKVSDEHCYMLIITEISEMVEADRKDGHADIKSFEDAIKAIKYVDDEEKDYFFKHAFEARIKDTVEDEFADIMTRLLDFIALRNIEYKSYNYELLTANIANCKFSEIGYIIVEQLIYVNDIRATIQLVIEITETLGIDLWWHVKQKMRYNKLRGYKHGNKKY